VKTAPKLICFGFGAFLNSTSLRMIPGREKTKNWNYFSVSEDKESAAQRKGGYVTFQRSLNIWSVISWTFRWRQWDIEANGRDFSAGPQQWARWPTPRNTGIKSLNQL
jgi:hypothetical protein